jgi:hypothetical protein
MSETRQAAPEFPARGPQLDEHEEERGDESRQPEEGDDSVLHIARRRASLNKEIRAGWQRALGH